MQFIRSQDNCIHFSKHSKIIIIDTPMFEVRHGEAYRLSKNIELGENIEGIKTNYTIQVGLTKIMMDS